MGDVTSAAATTDVVIEAGYEQEGPATVASGDKRRLEQVLGKPWAIVPEALVEISLRLATSTLDERPEIEAARGRRSLDMRSAGGGQVAVVPLQGTITPRGSLLSLLFGLGGGLQGFRDQFRQALNDPQVGAIVLDIDSPGGLVDLVPEAAAEIRNARGAKPIVAVANTLAASAAYWIAAQADELVVTPSGQVGSIGVFTVHEDFSRMEEAMGIKTTIISAGQFKTDGNPYEPLSKSARQALQNQVDDLYAMFTGDVAAGRGVSAQAVQQGYGRGRAVMADEALRLGMVDSVETLEDVIARLGGGTPPSVSDTTPSADADDKASPTTGDDTPPVRAAEDGDSHPIADYLSEARREQPAWLL